MPDSSQTHTKKSTEKATAEKTTYSEHSILYHRSADPSNGPHSLHPKYTQHQKISVEEIQNKKQKDIKQFFVSSTTNKITNTNNNKSKEVSNNIETTTFNLRHISKIKGKKPVGPNTTKENTKEKIKSSTDTVLNSNSNNKSKPKTKETEILQPPVQNYNLEKNKNTVAKKK